MTKTGSLQQGADRLSAVVHDVRERQRELSGADTLRPPLQSPSEVWSKKFMSEGFGADETMTPLEAGATTGAQHVPLMRELAARADAADKAKVEAKRLAAEATRPKPVAMAVVPMRTDVTPQKKRSLLGRLFGR